MEPIQLQTEQVLLEYIKTGKGLFDHEELNITSLFLTYYIPPRRLSDALSVNVEHFKHNTSPKVIRAWEELSSRLFQESNLRFDFIVRALGHAELIATGDKPIDALGKALATVTGAQYVPHALIKRRRNEPLHTVGGVGHRIQELKDNYDYNAEVNIPEGANILIIDDIATSHTTVKTIAKVLRAAIPNVQITVFTLGRTSHTIGINDKFDLTPFK